jgi:hypothetical protein
LPVLVDCDDAGIFEGARLCLPDLDDEGRDADVDVVLSASHRLLEMPEKLTERRPLQRVLQK